MVIRSATRSRAGSGSRPGGLDRKCPMRFVGNRTTNHPLQVWFARVSGGDSPLACMSASTPLTSSQIPDSASPGVGASQLGDRKLGAQPQVLSILRRPSDAAGVVISHSESLGFLRLPSYTIRAQ